MANVQQTETQPGEAPAEASEPVPGTVVGAGSDEATEPEAPPDPMRILIADDDAVSRKVLQATLTKWGYDVTTASDGNEAWAIMASETAPQLAVLDWMMPGLDGPQICEKVRALRDEPYTYMILLTGRSEKADLVKGMEAGADDYVTKPFDQHELNVRIRAGKRILDLQTELVAAREKLREQATHDALTGVRNRRAILDVLEQELNRGRRQNDPVAAVLVDLDHFKRVNDTYGHLSGDEVLREAAKRMCSVLRSYDAVGRYGGEEFLVVLSSCWPQIAKRIAERIRTVLAATPVRAPVGPINVSASFGVAVSAWEIPMDTDTLIQAADSALYRAKDAGRNRVEVAGFEDFDVVGVDA